MGSTFANFQVRCEEFEPVLEAARACCIGAAYVAPPVGGWAAVYSQEADDQDDAVLEQTAEDLSRMLETAVFGFAVYDSDTLRYVLYERGERRDAFDSWPDYHHSGSPAVEVVEEAEAHRIVILGRLAPAADVAQLATLLRPDRWPDLGDLDGLKEWARTRMRPEDRLTRLAGLLGIDQGRAYEGFRGIVEQVPLHSDRPIAGLRKVRGRARLRPRYAGPEPTLAETVEAGDDEAVRRLLVSGADPNEPGPWGHSPLSLAVVKGQREMAGALLTAGARPGPHDQLLLGVAAGNGWPEVVRGLLDAGADPNETGDGWGVTPLHHAMIWPTDDADRTGRVEALELLLRAGAEIEARAVVGPVSIPPREPPPTRTPLAAVALEGATDFAEVLIRAGADLEAKGPQGRTPLFFALFAAIQKQRPGHVAAFLAAGADPNVVDDEGATPLFYAIDPTQKERASLQLVRELLTAGADPTIPAPDGRSLADVADSPRFPRSTCFPKAAALLRDAAAGPTEPPTA